MKKCMDSENLHRRLKKIIGQINAIDRMIDEDVPCEDILMQINAANLHFINQVRLYLKVTYNTAYVKELSMVMQIELLKVLQKLLNVFQICLDKMNSILIKKFIITKVLSL